VMAKNFFVKKSFSPKIKIFCIKFLFVIKLPKKLKALNGLLYFIKKA
jgi:hypothetical protein